MGGGDLPVVHSSAGRNFEAERDVRWSGITFILRSKKLARSYCTDLCSDYSIMLQVMYAASLVDPACEKSGHATDGSKRGATTFLLWTHRG